MKVSTIIRVTVAVGLTAAGAWGIYFLSVNERVSSFLGWVQSMGACGPILLGLGYIIACVFFVPGSLLTLGAGFAFGVVKGFLTVWIAATLGATIAFLLGRTILRPWIKLKVAVRPRFQSLDNAVRREGFKIVLLTRLSPVFPFTLLNYAFGATNVSLRDYVLASWIGMLPGTLMYVYLGATIKEVADLAIGSAENRLGQTIFFWVGMAATIVVTAIVTRLARNALQETAFSVDSQPSKAPEESHGGNSTER